MGESHSARDVRACDVCACVRCGPCRRTHVTLRLHPCPRLASEQTKRSLSQSATAPISIESLHEGEDLRSTINRSMFDSITAPLTARIVAAVEDVLSKAAVTKAEIDQVTPLAPMHAALPSEAT